MNPTPAIVLAVTASASLAQPIFPSSGQFWLGSGNFLDSANWNLGNDPLLPSASPQIVFAPADTGSGFLIPAGPAILSSDFTANQGVTLYTGVDATLTVTNAATLSASVTVGVDPTNGFVGNASPATLNLANGSTTGTVSVGPATAGVLNVSGRSSIASSLSLATSTGGTAALTIAAGAEFTTGGLSTTGNGVYTVDNAGVFVAPNVFNGSTNTPDGSAVINRATGTLRFPNGGSQAGFRGDAEDTLTNEPGGLIDFDSSGTIEWTLDNRGTIELGASSLTLSGPVASFGTIIDPMPNGGNDRLSLSAPPLIGGPQTLDYLGDVDILGEWNPADELVLSGTPFITSISTSQLPTITNRSDATVADDFNAAAADTPVTVSNAAGARIAFTNGSSQAGFRGPADNLFMNEPDATVTFASSANIEWTAINEGTIESLASTVTFTGPLDNFGTLATGAGNAAITVNTTPADVAYMTAPGSTLAGLGRFNINTGVLTNEGVIDPGLLAPGQGDPVAGPLTFNVDILDNADTAVARLGIGDGINDTIVVEGAYIVGGQLVLETVAGFRPTGDEVFTIVQADGIARTFENAPLTDANVSRGVLVNTLLFDVTYTTTEITVSNVQIVEPCSPGDLSTPFGVIDIDDADAFIAAFLAGDPIADFVFPFGITDIDDVNAFIALFLDGCP